MIYDNSQISQYQKCPMSYYLQYIEGLRLIDEEKKNLGSEIHLLLENHYLGKQNQLSEKEQFFLSSYIDRNKDDNFKVLAVENKINIEIFNHSFVVKPDTVVEKNGNVFGFEHKVTGKYNLDDNYFSKYKTSGQVDAQIFAIKKEFGRCDGIIINGISIKELTRKPSSDRYNAFKNIDGIWYALEFGRDCVSKSEDKIIEWESNLKHWVDKLEKDIQANQWLKSTSSMGGMVCNMCDFLDICKYSHSTKLDESIIAMKYEKCNPLEYLEK